MNTFSKDSKCSSENKLVSVIIPTCNRSKLLSRALDSVINQTYQAVEIIIVDDNSTDDTFKVVSSYMEDHEFIKYIKNESNFGACVSRNKGIDVAEGFFLAFMDDDDEMLPDKIEVMINEYDDGFAFIGSGFYLKGARSTMQVLTEEYITLSTYLYKSTIGNQIIAETSRVREIGSFDINLTSSQEYDMWLRLIINFGTAKCVRRPLYVIHIGHGLPRISTSRGKVKGHLRFIQKHKRIMSKKHRKYHIYNLKYMKNRHVSFCEFFYLVPFSLMKDDFRGLLWRKKMFLKEFLRKKKLLKTQ